MSEDDVRRAFAGQQRQFDDGISDFRRHCERFSLEERAKIRAWLERFDAVGQEGLDFCMFPKVRVVNDDFDVETGPGPDFVCVEFEPRTLLQAIKTWDAGEDFAPPSIMG